MHLVLCGLLINWVVKVDAVGIFLTPLSPEQHSATHNQTQDCFKKMRHTKEKIFHYIGYIATLSCVCLHNALKCCLLVTRRLSEHYTFLYCLFKHLHWSTHQEEAKCTRPTVWKMMIETQLWHYCSGHLKRNHNNL